MAEGGSAEQRSTPAVQPEDDQEEGVEIQLDDPDNLLDDLIITRFDNSSTEPPDNANREPEVEILTVSQQAQDDADNTIMEGAGRVTNYRPGCFFQEIKFETLNELSKFRSECSIEVLEREWRQWFKKHHPGINRDTISVSFDEKVLPKIEDFFIAEPLENPVFAVHCPEPYGGWIWSPDKSYWQSIKAPVLTGGKYKGKRPRSLDIDMFERLSRDTAKFTDGKRCPLCSVKAKHPKNNQTEDVLHRTIAIKVDWAKDEEKSSTGTLFVSKELHASLLAVFELDRLKD